MVSNQQNSNSASDEPAETEKDWIKPLEYSNAKEMNVYWYTDAFNFPADSNAQIIIYTDAQLNEDGSFGFDDGNQWAVVLRSGAEVFPFMPRQFVQLGDVRVMAYLEYGKSDERFHVLVTVCTTAGIEITDYIYSEEENAFFSTVIYSASNINLNGVSR